MTSPINWNGMAGSGSYELQNGIGVHYTGIVFGPGANGPFSTLDLTLYNSTPGTAMSFPLQGTISNPTPPLSILSVLGTNCTMAGTACAKQFIAIDGTYSIASATQDVDAGAFVGNLSQVHFVEVTWPSPGSAMLVQDGGCVDLSTFNFNTRWP